MSVVLAKIMKPLNVDVLLTRSVMRKVLCLTQLLTWVELQVNLEQMLVDLTVTIVILMVVGAVMVVTVGRS